MKAKKNTIGKLLLAGLLATLTVGTGFCEIQRPEPVSAAAKKSSEKGEVDIATALSGLKTIQQRLRPFSAIVMEYTVEKKANHKGDWILYSRHHLIGETNNGLGGFFKEKSMELFSGNFFDINSKRTSLLYREKAWHGNRSVHFSCTAKYNEALRFENIYYGTDGKSYGGATASIFSGNSSLFCNFFRIYWPRTSSIFKTLEHAKSEAISATQSGDLITFFLKESDIRLVFDVKSGMLTQIATHTSFGSFDTEVFDITKSILKDGWQIPVEYVYTRRDNDGKVDFLERVKIDPASVRINPPLNDADFSVYVPVGARVYDRINNTEYKKTESDDQNQELSKGIKKKPDLRRKNTESKNEVPRKQHA